MSSKRPSYSEASLESRYSPTCSKNLSNPLQHPPRPNHPGIQSTGTTTDQTTNRPHPLTSLNSTRSPCPQILSNTEYTRRTNDGTVISASSPTAAPTAVTPFLFTKSSPRAAALQIISIGPVLVPAGPAMPSARNVNTSRL